MKTGIRAVKCNGCEVEIFLHPMLEYYMEKYKIVDDPYCDSNSGRVYVRASKDANGDLYFIRFITHINYENYTERVEHHVPRELLPFLWGRSCGKVSELFAEQYAKDIPNYLAKLDAFMAKIASFDNSALKAKYEKDTAMFNKLMAISTQASEEATATKIATLKAQIKSLKNEIKTLEIK